MNYRLIEKDGIKKWHKLIYNEATKKIDYQVIDGPITLDPKDYYHCDEVMINSNPPPDPSNTVPFEEFMQQLEEKFKNHVPKKFEPCIYYNRHSPGQALEVYLESDAHAGEWVSPHLTIYYSMEEEKAKRRVIGVQIDNIIALKAKSEA